MKRYLAAFAALVLVCVAAVVVAPRLVVSPDRLREQIEERIEQLSGLNLEVLGGTGIDLFPAPSITLNSVRITGSDGRLLMEADHVVASVGLLSLLWRTPEIAAVDLTRPRVDVSGSLGDVFSGNHGLVAAALASGKVVAVRMPPVKVIDGSVALDDPRNGRRIEATSINGDLVWLLSNEPLDARASFVWQGEPVTVRLTVEDPARFAKRQPTPVTFGVTAAPLELAFDGKADLVDDLHLSGAFRSRGPSLRSALRWVGADLGSGASLGAFAVKGTLDRTRSAVGLADAEVALDGNTAEGALKISTGEAKPVIQGTLAASNFALGPYAAAFELFTPTGRWNRRPIELPTFDFFGLDLRLSADEMTLGNLSLGRSALTVAMRDGELDMHLGEAQAFDGRLSGRLLFVAADDGVGVTAELDVKNIDLARGLGGTFGARWLEGRGTGRVRLEGHGMNLDEVVRSLKGEAFLNAADGAIVGINLSQLLTRMERAPLTGFGATGGRTPFETATGHFVIEGGKAATNDLSLASATLEMRLAGGADVPNRTLALAGGAKLARETSDGRAPFELPFSVGGTWNDVRLMADVKSRLMRSGAAKPLFPDSDSDGKIDDSLPAASYSSAEPMPAP